MQTRDEAFDDRARLELERAEPRDNGGIEKLPIAAAPPRLHPALAAPARPRAGCSTITSGVMRSDSA